MKFRRLLEGLRASRVLHGSAWILIGLAIQAVLGFAFWAIAARMTTSEDVGRASAIFTIVQFVNYGTGLGLTVMLARFATDASREANRLFGWSVVVGAVSSGLGALLFAHVGTTAATQLIVGSPLSVGLFCFYVSGVAVGLLADVRLMAGRHWRWLVGRIAIVGLVRLPLVLWDAGVADDRWLYHLMLGPLALGGWLSLPMLRYIGAGRVDLGRPDAAGPATRFALVNWVAALASTAPQFVLPLVVAAEVVAASYASFFLAWTVTGMVLLVPAAIAQMLLVEGAKDARLDAEASNGSASVVTDPAGEAAPAASPDPEGQALRFSIGIALVAWVGAFAGGQVLSLILGDGYHLLARTLPSLVFAGIPWAFTSVRLTEARLRRDQVATVGITLTLAVGILGPAWFWVDRWGIAGATRAWILGNVVAAAVAEVLHRRGAAASALSPNPESTATA